MAFRLTYSTMFDPPPELHERFDDALQTVRANLGRNYCHFIGGMDVAADTRMDDVSPINTDWVLGSFPVAGARQVADAVAAAEAAFSTWRATPVEERIRRARSRRRPIFSTATATISKTTRVLTTRFPTTRCPILSATIGP